MSFPNDKTEFTTVIDATSGVPGSGTEIDATLLNAPPTAIVNIEDTLGLNTDNELLGGYDDLAAYLNALSATLLNLDTWGGNLVRNFPPVEAVDGATPDLWNVTNDETVTNEDAAGEGIPEKHLRVYKVTMSADGGGVDFVYQSFEDANEPLLDNDVTKVSAGVWMYQKSTDTAGTITLELYDADGAASLGTDTTVASDAWTFLSVQDKTFQNTMRWQVGHSANDAIFYFCMPMLGIGFTVRPWRRRVVDSLVHFLAQSKPFNSKGNSFATIQGAIDDLAGAGWVFVPAGTWSEALTITNDDVLLFGAGWSSIVDGAAAGHAINISGDRCMIRDLQCKTTPGQANAYDGITGTGDSLYFLNVYVSQSDRHGIFLVSGTEPYISGCYIDTVDEHGVMTQAPRSRIIGNHIENCGTYGIYVKTGGDHAAISGNIISTTGDDGIYLHADGENCIVDGNRIKAWTNEAIDDDSGTSTIGDNDTTV